MWFSSHMVTKSLVEVLFSVHGLIFIESVRGPFGNNLFLLISSDSCHKKMLESLTIPLTVLMSTACNLWRDYLFLEKVYFRSQILEHSSIGEYWNISGVPVLSGNVIFTFFRTCWCHSEAHNTGMQKWFSIVQYLCTSIWDLYFFLFFFFFLLKPCRCLAQ